MFKRSVTWIALGIAAALCASVWSAAPRAGASDRTNRHGVISQAAPELPVVLVFPPDTSPGVSAELSDLIVRLEQSRLELSGKYHSLFLLSSLPMIRRAVTEGSLRVSDLQGPYDDNAKVLRVTSASGHSLALVTAIDDYSYDTGKKQVSVLMRARLIDFSMDPPKIVVDTVNGASPANAGRDSREHDVAQLLVASAERTGRDLSSETAALQAHEYVLAEDLVRDLTTELMNTISPVPPGTMPEAAPSGGRGSKSSRASNGK